jgi:hypothetical protein
MRAPPAETKGTWGKKVDKSSNVKIPELSESRIRQSGELTMHYHLEQVSGNEIDFVQNNPESKGHCRIVFC